MVWEDDPTLFLYKTDIPWSTIYTIRCQDMTKAVPLDDNDFEMAMPIPDDGVGYRRLLRNTTIWEPAYFKILIDYLAFNHYLVNCQGVVLLQVYPFDENVKIGTSVSIYVRLLDVVDLTVFGFSTRPSKVPPMKPMYFVDASPALVEDNRPKFDPSWMTNNWESDWVDIKGLEMIYSISDSAPKVQVTRAGFQFVDDNTTNVKKDYFYGIMFTSTYGTTRKEEFMVVSGLGDRITQARFDPNIWGTFGHKGNLYPTRKF